MQLHYQLLLIHPLLLLNVVLSISPPMNIVKCLMYLWHLKKMDKLNPDIIPLCDPFFITVFSKLLLNGLLLSVLCWVNLLGKGERVAFFSLVVNVRTSENDI